MIIMSKKEIIFSIAYNIMTVAVVELKHVLENGLIHLFFPLYSSVSGCQVDSSLAF